MATPRKARVAGLLSGRDPDKGAFFNAMLSLPSRLGGAILLAWGLAALAVGVFELLQPEAFDRAERKVFAQRATDVRPATIAACNDSHSRRSAHC